MKVVDVCAFYSPKGGGVKTYIDHKLRAAKRHGVYLTVIAPGRADQKLTIDTHGSIIYVQGPIFPLDPSYRFFSSDDRLREAVTREQPDVIEVSSPWRSARQVAEWDIEAIKSLVMHADPLSVYAYRWFERVAGRQTIDIWFSRFWRHLREMDERYDCVVSANSCLTQRLQRGAVNKATTIEMGVASGPFGPHQRDESLRTALLGRCGLGPSAVLLVGIGRHHAEKRWPMVIDAVTAAGCETPIGLVLIGGGRATPAINAAAAENPHICLLEAIDDRLAIARILASADALIHGSDAETFCMVAAEARASGIPLIGPNRGAFLDHVRQSGGFEFEAGDASSALAAIRRFCAADRTTITSQAVRKAPLVRTLEVHFEELFAYYRRLIASQEPQADMSLPG